LTRSIVSNPALNTNPAFRNPAIVPLGIEFVDDDLRKILDAQSEGMVDNLESMYYRQCQEEAELSGTRLPRSHDSKLWGFIYGHRLVSAQHELDTLSESEKFRTNYLKETITELTMKMNRYYPDLDYKSQVEAAKKEAVVDPKYTECYNEALGEVIVEDPQRFLSVFKNNAFIPAAADSSPEDKFGDYLPEEVEAEMVSHFELEWDLGSTLTSKFEPYLAKMSKMEGILSPKMDSLSKNLRKNFAGFLLQCFEQNDLDDVAFIVKAIESATSSVITDDVSSLSNDEVVRRSLSLLEEMGNAPALISKLYFGGKDAEGEVSGKSKDELISLLQGVDAERLLLVNQSLQIYQYLKYHSMTRLLLACLVVECPYYLGQFLNGHNGDDNITKFESANNDILDDIVSQQSLLYEHQDDLVQSLNALKAAMNGQISGGVELDLSRFPAAPCFVAQMLESALKTAKENGSILEEIKLSTFHKVVTKYPSSMSALSLMCFLMNPSRDGMDGNALKNMAFAFSTDASSANEILFGQITERLLQTAKLEAASVSSFKASLISSVDAELEELRSACGRYNSTRSQLEAAIQRLQFKFEGINFDHAKSNYDPLSTYLANFRYFTKYQ